MAGVNTEQRLQRLEQSSQDRDKLIKTSISIENITHSKYK